MALQVTFQIPKKTEISPVEGDKVTVPIRVTVKDGKNSYRDVVSIRIGEETYEEKTDGSGTACTLITIPKNQRTVEVHVDAAGDPFKGIVTIPELTEPKKTEAKKPTLKIFPTITHADANGSASGLVQVFENDKPKSCTLIIVCDEHTISFTPSGETRPQTEKIFTVQVDETGTARFTIGMLTREQTKLRFKVGEIEITEKVLNMNIRS